MLITNSGISWKKSNDDQREESITGDSEEDPVTGDSKRTLSLRTIKIGSLSLRTLKRTLSPENLKRNLLLWKLKRTLREPAGASGTSMTFTLQKSLLFYLVMVYDRVGDGDKHAYETLVLEDLVFILPVTKKVKLKNFSCNSWIPCNSH